MPFLSVNCNARHMITGLFCTFFKDILGYSLPVCKQISHEMKVNVT